jgi:hypothetical protein
MTDPRSLDRIPPWSPQRAAMRAARRRLRAASGRCNECRKPAAPGRTRCRGCLERQRGYKAALAARKASVVFERERAVIARQARIRHAAETARLTAAKASPPRREPPPPPTWGRPLPRGGAAAPYVGPRDRNNPRLDEL